MSDDKDTSLEGVKDDASDKAQVIHLESAGEPVTYRLYKRRFLGLVGLVLLNVIAAMPWPWYGPISNNMATEFGFTLDQINWLGNIMALVYLPTAILIPHIVSRFGIRRCCDFGALCMLLSAWIRYSGTIRTLPIGGSYALVVIGQLFSAFAQPVYQILGPKYSENWFDLKGRTTATMIVSVANPVGGALGQLISPLVGDTRQSILVLGILSTAVIPFVFFVQDSPPTPPTYAASVKSPSLWSLLRGFIGVERNGENYMTRRERFDFAILVVVFGLLVGIVNAFSILTAEIMQPAGYSSSVSGLMGATLLLSGLVAAFVTSPLFDRVFTHHLALTCKVLIPINAAAWLSLIWAVKPNNTGGLFAIMAIIGVASLPGLPVALELGVELTRNAEGSTSLLWFSGNLLGVMFILCGGALRASASADPPLNMRRALIFNGAFISAASIFVFLLKGKQVRKALDEQKLQESLQASARGETAESRAAQGPSDEKLS